MFGERQDALSAGCMENYRKDLDWLQKNNHRWLCISQACKKLSTHREFNEESSAFPNNRIKPYPACHLFNSLLGNG